MAQIVTITNPLTGQPAQVDQLEHTAQEIDDSIGRALPGGEIDTLLAGKAPAGYGLGTTAKLLTADDNLDNIRANGFYGWANSLPTNAPTMYMSMRVENDSYTGHVVQTLTGWNDSSNPQMRRIRTDSGWQPWEYINPPMKLGVEYRTTERYLGKPVYCMTKHVGEVAANTVTQVIFTSSDIGKYCIRAFCTGKRTFSNWEDSETSMVSSPAGSDTIITCDPTIYRLSEGYRSIRAYIKSSANLKDVYCTAYYTKWAD